MTIDDAEIARLRTDAEMERYANSDVILRLLDELEKARADGQRQYEHNVEQIAKFAAVEAERDSARALLRDLVKLIDWTIGPEFRAHIAAELGDKP